MFRCGEFRRVKAIQFDAGMARHRVAGRSAVRCAGSGAAQQGIAGESWRDAIRLHVAAREQGRRDGAGRGVVIPVKVRHVEVTQASYGTAVHVGASTVEARKGYCKVLGELDKPYCGWLDIAKTMLAIPDATCRCWTRSARIIWARQCRQGASRHFEVGRVQASCVQAIHCRHGMSARRTTDQVGEATAMQARQILAGLGTFLVAR